ncbi:MAG: glycosyltransferase [Verrucomicrobiaceae bacterium]|nr:glycosyltransferase [Verrucomicrobiaceae bacterium]
MKASVPRVSVVIPTRARTDLLMRCLTALLNQTLQPTFYEILVVDDGPTEETRHAVEKLAAHAPFPAVRYLHTRGATGPAAARNQGWRNAAAEIIAFTDDDTVPAPGWLENGIASLYSDAVAVSGRVAMDLPDLPTDYERNAFGLASAEFVTANCFCRRQALQDVGGFDEQFTAAWREDSDLHFTLLEAGGRIVASRDAVVHHPIRPAPWGISLKQQRNNRFEALLYKKHPALYRSKVGGAPASYYINVGLLLAGVAFYLMAAEVLAAFCALAWVVQTGLFCWQRVRRNSHAPGHLMEMVMTSVLIPPVAVFWRLYGAFKSRVWFA